MSEVTHFRNLREENSFRMPDHWIYRSINPVFKLQSANQIVQNNCLPVKLELS